MNLDDGSWKLYIIFIFRVIKSDSGNKEENHGPSNEILVYRSSLAIPYCNSHPISISRWCSIEGALEGIDTAKHALKLAPLEARSTLLPYDHPVRHSPHPGSREYRKGSNCCALASLPQCGQIVRVYSRIIWKESQQYIFSFYSNLLISLNRTFVLINL